MDVKQERVLRVVIAGVGVVHALIGVTLIGLGVRLFMTASPAPQGQEGASAAMGFSDFGFFVVAAGLFCGLLALMCFFLHRKVRRTSQISVGGIVSLGIAALLALRILTFAWGFYSSS